MTAIYTANKKGFYKVSKELIDYPQERTLFEFFVKPNDTGFNGNHQFYNQNEPFYGFAESGKVHHKLFSKPFWWLVSYRAWLHHLSRAGPKYRSY